ncbi:hypothetical protein DVA67_031800 [Solirubrobacter sp. CPCC 204708]|uniref:PepSY domain-containing protein n=1 Tax=Solirubrobacter deserti TaxID=2282478 RepID=A0ABT4RQD9_9ACTN|nr:hypothetical protein [Solirubrobacter deserti]MBE2320587.1 hypothetical protein [Solirubrobacter deserti]MDA0140784.1 hypothetical protein [Solirubrobacter deserti]
MSSRNFRSPWLAALLVVGGCGSHEQAPPANPIPARYAAPQDSIQCPVTPSDDRLVPAPQSFDARSLIGLEEQAAVRLARRHGCVVRVVFRDGRGGLVEGSSQFNRIDVYVQRSTIVGVEPIE